MSSITRKLDLGFHPQSDAAPQSGSAGEFDQAIDETGSLSLYLLLAAVVVLAFAVRLIGLNSVGFNTDEAVYAGQAAGILNDADLRPYFPVFRAHPLLFQFVLALAYAGAGVNDYVGRLVSVVMGAITLLVVFGLGRTLYSARTGLVAALFMALMPYHVIVTRQVLLDGPMTLFASLALCAMALFARRQHPRYLYAAGACIGLTFLSKETGIIFVVAFYLFIVFSPSVRVRWRDLALSLVIMVALMAIFPLTIALSGAGRTGQSYLLWQLLRQPNHAWSFYISTVLPMIGYALVLAACVGILMRWRRRTWRETLLATWILAPVVFFQSWPLKGYQYLLPITPAIAVLAAVALTHAIPAQGMLQFKRLRVTTKVLRLAATIGIALTLAVPTLISVRALPTIGALAGMGGLPGGRETGQWFKANTPVGTQAIAIGPNLANLIQFYGHRKTHMLSVSQNPLQRNPSYEPIDNPDLRLRNGDLHYIVWDAYSAARSPFFARKLLGLVKRFNGRETYAHTVSGAKVIIVYEVRP